MEKLVCRFAGKDILWYTREKHDGGDAAQQSELATVKAREEELMLEVRSILSLALISGKLNAQMQPQEKLYATQTKRSLETKNMAAICRRWDSNRNLHAPSLSQSSISGR